MSSRTAQYQQQQYLASIANLGETVSKEQKETRQMLGDMQRRIEQMEAKEVTLIRMLNELAEEVEKLKETKRK